MIKDCSYCEGTHFGSANCPFLCEECGKDTRDDAVGFGKQKCECPKKIVEPWPKKLKPCPFCSQTPITNKFGHVIHDMQNDRALECPLSEGPTFSDAQTWNTRPGVEQAVGDEDG